MSLRVRLFLSSLFGLVAVIGLAVTAYLVLPGQADEVLRRQAENAMQTATEDFDSRLLALAAPLRAKLDKLAADRELTSLDVGEAPEAADLAEYWELARDLSARYGLDNLVIVHKSGLLLSLHPEAAQVGMQAPKRLLLAQSAAARPVLSAVDVKADAPDAPVLKLALSASIKGELFALVDLAVSEEDLAAIAGRYGLTLAAFARGVQNPPTDPDKPQARLFPLKDPQGGRVATLLLAAPNAGGRFMEKLLMRSIVMIAVPWALFAALVLIWLGWPKGKRDE